VNRATLMPLFPIPSGNSAQGNISRLTRKYWSAELNFISNLEYATPAKTHTQPRKSVSMNLH